VSGFNVNSLFWRKDLIVNRYRFKAKFWGDRVDVDVLRIDRGNALESGKPQLPICECDGSGVAAGAAFTDWHTIGSPIAHCV
jgi:hypothetical protein